MALATGPWSDFENDLIVADYFRMLAEDLGRRPYNKARHNRELQQHVARQRTSIEFKHQNISAVLKALGEAWIEGYKPAFNFQASLEDAVVRWLSANPQWGTGPPDDAEPGLTEPAAALWLDPPPTLRNEPPPQELDQTLRIARKFDVAGRDERNRVLGKAGEERILKRERALLVDIGRADLARDVRWVAQEDGDGAGYDIASFDPNGRARLIEVKTTNGWERTPFLISHNELAVAEERRSEWCLVRLWNFSREPRAFELRPPLNSHVTLTATTFQAAFQ